MYFGTVSCITALCLVVGGVKCDVTNSSDVQNSTTPLNKTKTQQEDAPKESNQRRRGMESEMAYPQGYFPPFMGDVLPSTPSYRRVPVRRESVPIIIERTVSSQPALITRNPLQGTYMSNVYNTPGGYFQSVPNYQTSQIVYKPQETYDESYQPLFQQQGYAMYQDPNRSYQPQIYQQNQYQSVPSYNYQQASVNPYQNTGYADQPIDNTRTLESEIQTLRELEEQHRRLVQHINARTQGAVYYNSDSTLTRKVVTQYPNQDAPQYTTQPSYPSSSQNTILIMDPASQGVIPRNPYTGTQVRISRHPGQIPAPDPIFVPKNKRNDAMETKGNFKMVEETQMAVPVLIKVKVSSTDPGNVWDYYELKSTEHIRSIYQPGPLKPLVPYPDLLPPCPGGFLCDDTIKPTTQSADIDHTNRTPGKDNTAHDEEANKNDPNGRNTSGLTWNGATGEPTPGTDEASTDSPMVPEEPQNPEKGDTDKFIFLGSDDPEDSAEDNDIIGQIDPRSSPPGSVPSEDKSAAAGIE